MRSYFTAVSASRRDPAPPHRWFAHAFPPLEGIDLVLSTHPHFDHDAVDAVCGLNPQVACMGHRGKVGLLNAWPTRLSVALQKANAACLLQAGRVRDAADLAGGSGWDEDLEDLLRDAAAAAAAGGLDG